MDLQTGQTGSEITWRSQKTAKIVLICGCLELLKLWNGEAVHECYWVCRQEAAITKCCLAGGTVPGRFLQCVKNPKKKLKLADPSLWTTGEQKFTEFVSFVADILSSHGEITLHIYKALCLVWGR